jgi:hypothetical protein
MWNTELKHQKNKAEATPDRPRATRVPAERRCLPAPHKFKKIVAGSVTSKGAGGLRYYDLFSPRIFMA